MVSIVLIMTIHFIVCWHVTGETLLAGKNLTKTIPIDMEFLGVSENFTRHDIVHGSFGDPDLNGVNSSVTPYLTIREDSDDDEASKVLLNSVVDSYSKMSREVSDITRYDWANWIIFTITVCIIVCIWIGCWCVGCLIRRRSLFRRMRDFYNQEDGDGDGA